MTTTSRTNPTIVPMVGPKTPESWMNRVMRMSIKNIADFTPF